MLSNIIQLIQDAIKYNIQLICDAIEYNIQLIRDAIEYNPTDSRCYRI